MSLTSLDISRIANLARLGCDGMAQADRVVLDIMVAKS